MKFEIQVGTDYSTVKFNATLKLDVFEILIHHFERLGGIMVGPKASDWTFPSYITSEVIQEVIHNTCFVCGGLMRDDYYEEIKGAIKFNTAIRKCSSCGHSHT